MELDRKEMERALRLWFQPGDVFEIRVIDAKTRAYYRPHIESGYFDYDHIDVIAESMRYILSAKGVYVTVNPVRPELLNRAVNRIRSAGREPTTSDKDILCRRWLLIDCDAKRASGIPSSEDEHDAAMGKALEIQSGVDVFTRKKLSMQVIAIELAICYLEEDKPEEDKKSHELTASCGDCKYYHPYGVDRYGHTIGECYAQKDAPTVGKNERSCSMFDWKIESEEVK